MTKKIPKPCELKKQSNRLLNGCMTTLGFIIMLPFIFSIVSGILHNVSRTFDPRTADQDRMISVVSNFIDNTRNNDFKSACANFELKVPRLSCQDALKLVRDKRKNVFLEFSKVGNSQAEFLKDSAILSGGLMYPGPPTGYFDALFVREKADWRIRAIKMCIEDPFNEAGGSQCVALDPFNNFK
jgi:hypothetical protein